jgi:hypothetical protein
MVARHVIMYRRHALLSAQLSIPVVRTAHRPVEVKRGHSHAIGATRHAALSHAPCELCAPPLTLTLTRDLAMARALGSVLTGTRTAQASYAMVRVRGSVGMRVANATHMRLVRLVTRPSLMPPCVRHP